MTNENNSAALEIPGGNPREASNALAKAVADEVVRAIEARWGDALAKLALLPKIRTAAVAARENTTLALHRLDGGNGGKTPGVESCTLHGTRRSQFLRACELKKSDPDASLRRCAKQAIEENCGPDGYASVGALVEYVSSHRSWWDVPTAPDASGEEGGVPCM